MEDSNALQSLLSLVYLVAESHSSSLAIECADLLNPKHWPGKNMSFETFMTAKLFLLTEGEISASGADELLRGHLQGTSVIAYLLKKNILIYFIMSSIRREPGFTHG
jgi:hypothetical protein